MNNINRRQFVIMSRPYESERFKYLELWDDKILSYHEDLKVVYDNGVCLIGYAFSVKSEKICLDKSALQEKRYWSGRWILLCDKQLHMDASGNLACNYAYDKNGELYVSSSIYLLQEVVGCEKDSNYVVKHGDGNGMLDYYPIPHTVMKNVFRLLPSQFLDFDATEVVQNVNDYMVRRYKDKTYDWIMQEFIAKMSVCMKNIEREFSEEVWVTLTGGVDSRTIFAIAQHAGISFQTYTAKRKRIARWDEKYPKRIAKKYDKTHIIIDDTQEGTEDRKKEFDTHSAECAVGTERQQYISGSDVPIKKQAVVLWGTVWPIYIKSYHQCFENGKEEIEEQLSEIQRICGNIVSISKVHQNSLRSWLEWIKRHPIEGLDWRERMYLEQRTGAWIGTAAQAIDMFDSVRIAPVNCQDLLELLLSLNVSPGDKGFQKDIVERCCPKLRRIPYGERTDIVYRGIRKMKKIIKKVCER